MRFLLIPVLGSFLAAGCGGPEESHELPPTLTFQSGPDQLVVSWRSDEIRASRDAEDSLSRLVPMEKDVREELLKLFMPSMLTIYREDERINAMEPSMRPTATSCPSEKASLACQAIAMSAEGIYVKYQAPEGEASEFLVWLEDATVLTEETGGMIVELDALHSWVLDQ